MNLFGKKKEEKPSKGVPQQKVNQLVQQGLSDKEIIKRLKKEGYGYSQIEKAMLNAVKSGVGGKQQARPAPQAEKQPSPAKPSQPPQPPQPPQPQPAQQPPQRPESMGYGGGEPEMPSTEELGGFEGPPKEGELSPEMAIEELVEGVVEEKWTDVGKRMDRIEGQNQDLKNKLDTLKERIDNIEKKKPEKKEGKKIKEIKSNIEDLDTRIDALEKAFKQFLPSLTDNIEALSDMVSEMKKRRRE